MYVWYFRMSYEILLSKLNYGKIFEVRTWSYQVKYAWTHRNPQYTARCKLLDKFFSFFEHLLLRSVRSQTFPWTGCLFTSLSNKKHCQSTVNRREEEKNQQSQNFHTQATSQDVSRCLVAIDCCRKFAQQNQVNPSILHPSQPIPPVAPRTRDAESSFGSPGEGIQARWRSTSASSTAPPGRRFSTWPRTVSTALKFLMICRTYLHCCCNFVLVGLKIHVLRGGMFYCFLLCLRVCVFRPGLGGPGDGEGRAAQAPEAAQLEAVLPESVPAGGLPGQREQRLPGVPKVGHRAGLLQYHQW